METNITKVGYFLQYQGDPLDHDLLGLLVCGKLHAVVNHPEWLDGCMDNKCLPNGLIFCLLAFTKSVDTLLLVLLHPLDQLGHLCVALP